MSNQPSESKEKRTSPYCASVRVRIVYTKRIIAIFLLIMLVIPLLYLIPSATTKVRLSVPANCTYEPFDLVLFNKNTLSYENSTVLLNDGFTDWKVSSVELYLNSYIRNINESTMIQYVIYGKDIPSLKSYNNMKIILFQNTSGYKIQNINTNLTLNGYNSLTLCPVDYILSYLKLTIVSTHDNLSFSIDFYHFFRNDRYIELKYSLSTEIIIDRLSFNNFSYYNWYNWKFNNDIMPNTYPYLINTTIRRYNSWNDRLGVGSI